jgi:hypothetical protein
MTIRRVSACFRPHPRQVRSDKTGDFDPAWLEDRYRTALVSILREKKRAELPTKHAAAKPSQRNVINLMDALRRSLGGRGLGEEARDAEARSDQTCGGPQTIAGAAPDGIESGAIARRTDRRYNWCGSLRNVFVGPVAHQV